MASGSHSHGHGLDSMITVKVQFAGVTRRTKMALRDMTATTFEPNIRQFLRFPSDAPIIVERYSDSAGKYVHLDPRDVAIYKQLYRAAKAKSKLKIRVSFDVPQPPRVPQPVTVEDEPEVTSKLPAANALEKVEEKVEKVEEVEGRVEEKVIETNQEPQQSQADISPTLAPEETNNFTSEESATLFDLPYRDCPLSNPTTKFDDEFKTHFNPEVTEFAKLIASRVGFVPHQPEVRSRWEIPVNDRLPTRSVESTSVLGSIPEPDVSYSPACPAAGTAFAVCCNNCEKTIPDIHYHCSTCDDGDFDLCQSCLDRGSSCKVSDHWLIKRTIVDGRLVNSTTETLEPKPKAEPKPVPIKCEPVSEITADVLNDVISLPKSSFEPLATQWASLRIMRTCNCCVQELPEHEFLHCETCEDYDLCQPCFSKNAHGHHPMHGFQPAVKGSEMPSHIKAKMAPGRSQKHFAICDGCDNNIVGVRHKCIDCPDWDYCAECINIKDTAHPKHRFVPVYEQLPVARRPSPVHVGICCDGPLCSGNEAYPAYIHGTRYKCAICNDRDYCANCQSCPLNTHNKTHPMIMFRTPVSSVSIVTTDGERNGQPARVLGDIHAIRAHKATEVAALNRVQTNVDIKPSEPVPVKAEKEEPEVKEEKEVPAPVQKIVPESNLSASFLCETIRDGTVMPGNHVFEQTWVLRNNGKVPWPTGCSVKFVGGDYMGHVDSNHPAGISELVSASESTVCYNQVAPGQESPFTVLLRTPARAGNLVSYWRLTAPSGHKFGDRLWCDVHVRNVRAETKSETQSEKDKADTPVKEVKKAEDSQASSQMIFPRLEKESPVASIHEAVISKSVPEAEQAEVKAESGDEDWDISEDGFMTDEEYDILDASDEEYLLEQKKQLVAK